MCVYVSGCRRTWHMWNSEDSLSESMLSHHVSLETWTKAWWQEPLAAKMFLQSRNHALVYFSRGHLWAWGFIFQRDSREAKVLLLRGDWSCRLSSHALQMHFSLLPFISICPLSESSQHRFLNEQCMNLLLSNSDSLYLLPFMLRNLVRLFLLLLEKHFGLQLADMAHFTSLTCFLHPVLQWCEKLPPQGEWNAWQK